MLIAVIQRYYKLLNLREFISTAIIAVILHQIKYCFLNEIIKMKQTAAPALGILLLNTVFVQSECDDEFCK